MFSLKVEFLSKYLKWKRDNITLNNFLLHVLNHALKRFLIQVFVELINYSIHYLFNKNIFSNLG